MNTINTSLSGLKAYQTKLDVNANNIANANTANFKEQSVSLSSINNNNGNVGGVSVSRIGGSNSNDNINTNNINSDNNTINNNNDVDLSKQLVEMKENSLYFQANAQVIKTQNQNLGSLLDTFA